MHVLINTEIGIYLAVRMEFSRCICHLDVVPMLGRININDDDHFMMQIRPFEKQDWTGVLAAKFAATSLHSFADKQHDVRLAVAYAT